MYFPFSVSLLRLHPLSSELRFSYDQKNKNTRYGPSCALPFKLRMRIPFVWLLWLEPRRREQQQQHFLKNASACSGLKYQISSMTVIVTPASTLGITYAAMMGFGPDPPELGVEAEPECEVEVGFAVAPVCR